MAGGRPTKYTPELIAKAKAYLIDYESLGDAVPNHAGMAFELEVSRGTLYDWARDPEKSEFSNILERCNQTQERLLLSGGLASTLNGNIVKLMLGKHGYHDKQQTELTGANGGPIEASWTILPVKPKDA